ncbi:hypothetical protein DSECCO2_332240 [anaerobic digester metagenome]
MDDTIKQIRILMIEKGIKSEAALAKLMGITPQNLSKKMKRNNFTEEELHSFATALDCDLEIVFNPKPQDTP